MNRWKRKVIALKRLAEDQQGKPEGELARQKMREILAKYPEAREYGPAQEFMLSDLAYMQRYGISTGGRWTAESFEAAFAMMVSDYRRRIEDFRKRETPPKLLGGGRIN